MRGLSYGADKNISNDLTVKISALRSGDFYYVQIVGVVSFASDS